MVSFMATDLQNFVASVGRMMIQQFLSILSALAVSAVAAEKAPIVLVLTNHSELGETGKKTGFYLSEAAHPYAVFKEAGYPVVLASPKGGGAPVDLKSMDLKDKENKAFWDKFGKEGGVPETKVLSSIDAKNVAGVFFAGGHGTVWDFPNSEVVSGFITKVDANKGVIGAVCHGPAAFVGAKGADGEALVKGKTIAIFTNAEEEAVGLTKVVPFLLESKLEEAGGKVQLAKNFSENAVRDGRLVTGQNPASAKKAAELFVEALK